MEFCKCIIRASLFGALLMLMCTPGALALNEFQKLTASDAAAGDNFGFSASLSGDTAVIGAWNDDRPGILGDNSGSAYVFKNNGSGSWTQIGKLTASDAMAEDSFGSSVSVSGNTAVVGALLRDGTGGAYVFQDNGAGEWIQIDTLSANDAADGDEFGYSIAVSGNTAIVGAWKDNTQAGAAYVFRDDGLGDWTQIAQLIPDDAMPGDHFGVSVAIDGTTAMVGSYFDSNPAGPVTGAVYIFQDNGTAWTQADKLIANDASFGNQFGAAVALSGDRAIIGATGDATAGAIAGAAYIFQRDAAMTWHQADKLIASDAAQSDLFGFSVGIDGSTAVVGAYQNDDGGIASGSAYFFKESALGSWNQVAKLIASDDAAGDAFGYNVAVGGPVALIGAPLGNSSATDSGAAYLFNVPAGIAGDYNQDGAVDTADYVAWRDLLGQSAAGLAADGNGDGTVDQADYQLWRANFGLGSSATSAALAAVPEPATAALLLAALALTTLARRRHGALTERFP